MAGSAVSAAASSLGRLAGQEASFLCEFLREDLRTLQTFLSVAAEAQRASGEDAVAADSVRRIRDAAYEAENIVEAADYRVKRNSRCKGLLGAMSRYARKPSDLVALHKLGKDIVRVRRRIQEVKPSREILDTIDAGKRLTTRAQEPSARRACLSRAAATSEDTVVGLEGDDERIVEWLKDPGNPQLTFVSIVAMGGAGKTTLARKVYNSAAVKEHSDAFAFVSISQQFEVLHVLKELRAQATGIKRKDREFDRIRVPSQVEELERWGNKSWQKSCTIFLKEKGIWLSLMMFGERTHGRSFG